ncbi:DUF1289 domain-containing protein [Ancylobacter oerskovii]|uniref:DUF1289 domain-containing protein n=1 Tax=Ancylobacter oerskovii TaxID=459519 RepID=A0ABW4Z010_9HYPH|nr:DUF1289 domain-containing protein [Ancylobacter oerskovii]MBS7543800.1 DUF1289 domain-containing protein [Ancylobacter oerskovii]
MPKRVSTPCIGVCALDTAGRSCIGCGRTLEEIGAWPSLDETARRAIMNRLARQNRRESGR